MRILAIEPYFGLSHKSFLEGYRRFSEHDIEIWDLPPRKWKWRMRGSAYHFAERARGAADAPRFDAILASDFLNLPDFLALAPESLRSLPTVAYFHENQMTYPLGEHAPVEFHYGWINLSTALCADQVIFNSQHHRREFFSAVTEVFEKMPDYVPKESIERLFEGARVLPVGIDFERHEAAFRSRVEGEGGAPRLLSPPTILWNHRWEYDKGPALFLHALKGLEERGVDFRLVVCGQSFKKKPPAFKSMRDDLGHRLDHFGFFESQDEYLRAASRCDVVVSTSVHEFFGVSVVEAIHVGCLPVLPKRLSYPEIIPPHLHPLFLYEEDRELVDFLERFLSSPPIDYRDELRCAVSAYDWKNLAADFDAVFESLVGTRA